MLLSIHFYLDVVMALTKFHALIEVLMHAIGKEAITIVC